MNVRSLLERGLPEAAKVSSYRVNSPANYPAFFRNECDKGHSWGSINEPSKSCFACNDLGEIRPDLDTLLAADSVCLRTSSNLPQSGNL